MNNKVKTEFRESPLPCYPLGVAYETGKHRVVFYEYSTMGNMITPRKHWRAYALPSGMCVNGEKEYATKEEAMKACQ